MGTPWYPPKDADFLTFGQNWSTHATATPTAFGWVAADATALAPLVTAFATALSAASDPGTRTSVTVAAKDVAKAGLLAELKALKKKLEAAQPPIPVDKRELLGLGPKDVKPTPIPPPSTKPALTLVGIGRLSVVLTMHDETTQEKKAKPYGVDGAAIFSYVPAKDGDAIPDDLEKWRFEGISTRSKFQVEFNGEDVGCNAHICARWLNPRGQAGPASDRVAVKIAA